MPRSREVDAVGDPGAPAISIPEYTPAAATSLEIEGPAQVQEYTTASYKAWVRYSDGRVRDRTKLAAWSVLPGHDAMIDELGELTVGELLAPSEEVVVRAVYQGDEAEVEDQAAVTLGISVSLEEFIERNIAGALAAKRRALEALEEAEARESAAILVIQDQIDNLQGRKNFAKQSLDQLLRARFWCTFGQRAVRKGVAVLEEDPAGQTRTGT